jgi:hypothetical protein
MLHTQHPIPVRTLFDSLIPIIGRGNKLANDILELNRIIDEFQLPVFLQELILYDYYRPYQHLIYCT